MKKRMSKLFLTVAMVITLMSVMSVTASAAAEDYVLYVGGVQVTNGNLKIDRSDNSEITNGSATFDPANNTLTLENFTYAGAGHEYQSWSGPCYAAIYADVTLKVVLKGENTITAAGQDSGKYYSGIVINGNQHDLTIVKADDGIGNLTVSGKYYGIYADSGNVTISGSSTVTVNATAASNYVYGIYAGDNVTISGGEVTVNATSVSSYAYGIYAGSNVTISGSSTVTVDATSASSYVYGIYAYGTFGSDSVAISDSSKVAVTVEGSGAAKGIYAQKGKITISGSEVDVTAEGGTNVNDICAYNGDIAVSNSTVKITATGTSDVYGIYTLDNGSVTISGGTVKATSTGTAISSRYNITIENNTQVTAKGSYGIRARDGDITISGSTVYAGDDDNITTNYGIYASGNVEISGSSTVTTMGALYGIYADGGNTSISNSEVTVTAKSNGSGDVYGFRSKTVAISDNSTVTVNATSESGEAYGIYAGGSNPGSGNVTISGGEVTVNATSESGEAYGIYTKISSTANSGNVTISGGEVTVNATSEGSSSAYGIYTVSTAYGSQPSNNSNVTISGGEVTVDATAVSGSAYGIYTENGSNVYSGNVEISGNSKVDVTAQGSSNAYGIYTNNSNYDTFPTYGNSGKVAVSGGQVTVKATAANGEANGIWIKSYGQVTISGGDVNVTAEGSSNAYGIYANSGSLTISGGDVTVNATTEGSGEANGIYGKSGNLTISGGDVNVTAEGSSSAYGIRTNGANRGNITISGSTVTATSTGIAISAYSRITISNNGAVTASGDSKAMNKAPDVSQVAAGYIITASENANGSDPVTYNASSINSYKYIEIGPAIPTYAITTETATNGTVTVEKNSAKAGATVTITATPDDGYEVDTITVTKDGGGSAVEVTNNTFTMPDYDVTVSVTFRKLEILEQPAAGNDYTVTASGTPTYQWYKVIESEDGFLVTEEFLNKGNGIAEGHGTYDSTTGNWTAAGSYLYGYFMIYMNSGDTLTVTFSDTPGSVFLSGSNLGTITYGVQQDTSNTYVFTAPYGEDDTTTRDIYILLLMPSGEVPTMRAVYKGSALEAIDQTNAALDTDGLASGTYVCRVTWVPGSPENYSGIYTLSEPVEYTAPAPAPAPKPAPSGGSSSSGITSKTEKNEDGSTTTTTTNRITGTVTETTKTPDGTTGTTVTDKSGNITAVSATVPAAAASAAEKTGKPVTVPVEVPVAKRSEDALPIKVEIPTGGVTVEIPVENVTPGTVVVIVAKDGTEQVVRTSSVSETGVVVNLAQDATVKVVDMSHNFVDVHPVNHWAADAIDFVAARGIFNGTSADVFTPDGSMTRQAMWMTLARMSGEEPADMAAARDWAVANAVSDGSNPLSTVTRQQYVTMLWRWAEAEGMDVSAGEETNLLSFTDANKISDYAVEAFRWACGEGIVDGYNDDTLRAMTNASRAHAAAMMMRFCAGMVN